MLKMDKALEMVRALVATGMEYPDAEWKTSWKLKLNRKQVEHLREMYDAPDEA